MDMKTFMCDRQTANRVVRNAEATQESRQQVSSKNASGRKRRRKARSAVKRARLTPKRLFDADAETQVASAGEESAAHEEEEEDQDMADDASEEGHAEQKQDDEEDEEKRSCGSPSEDKDLFGDRFAFHTPKGAGTKKYGSSSKDSVVAEISGKPFELEDVSPPSTSPAMDDVRKLLPKLDQKLRDALPSQMPAYLV